MPHIPELDGVRGIAALAVFFHHAWYSTLSTIHLERWPAYVQVMSKVSSYGDKGVDLFFVLSGFLITSILVQERESPRYYQDFYWKRALRILPLYLVVLILDFALTHQTGYFVLSLFFIVNFQSVLHVAGFGPFWTLAIEEQFYITWPTIVRRRNVERLRGWAIGLGVTSFVLRILFAIDGKHNYYLSFLRCDGLAFGALLACHFNVAKSDQTLRRSWDRYLIWTACLGVLLSCAEATTLPVAILSAMVQTGTVLWTGSVVGLVISRTGSKWLGWLRSQFLIFFGLISYALYLMHLYLLEIWDHFAGEMAPGDMRAYWLRTAGVFTATVVLSVLSRYVIELPAMRLRRFVLKSPKEEGVGNTAEQALLPHAETALAEAPPAAEAKV